MCRKEKIWSLLLISFGLGVLTAGFIESTLFCFILGLILSLTGILIINKRA